MNIYTKKRNNNWLQADHVQNFSLKVIIVLLLLVGLNIFSNQVRNVFYSSTAPVFRVFLQSGSGTFKFFDTLLNTSSLYQETMSAKKENQDLLFQVSVLEEKLRAYGDTAAIAEKNSHDTYKTVLTKVVGLDLAHDVIVINEGLEQGISENMPLVSKENVVYGKVLKTYQNFSQVTLISAKNSTLNVKIQSHEEAQPITYGAVRGMGDQGIFLDLVDSESMIKEGDVLVTSGLEGVFPANLLIGTIKTVNKSDVKPFQTAQVKPFFELKNLENLFIITNYLQK